MGSRRSGARASNLEQLRGTHPGDTLLFLADDRALRIQRDGRSLKEAGIATPLLRPLHYRGWPRIYRTDRDTLDLAAIGLVL